MSGITAIKGVYEVCELPWAKEKQWNAPNQIEIKAIIELEEPCDFKYLVKANTLALFNNIEPWYTAIQGINAIRKLTDNDFETIYHYVQQQDKEIQGFLEDDTNLKNDTVETIINRIKRHQQIVTKLKDKYNNHCQIDGCNFTFKKKNGGFYSEVHHLVPLSQGGSQGEDNVVILCPNHHRMFHFAYVEIGELKNSCRKIKINNINYDFLYK